jgi:hypothetical protein
MPTEAAAAAGAVVQVNPIFWSRETRIYIVTASRTTEQMLVALADSMP